MSHRFDILMPFYGDIALMKAAVGSVLAQDSDDWHLTVVEDAMPDPAAHQFLSGLTDRRVTYLRNEDNLGANANYRKALALAGADYVVVMGADDLLLPHYVSSLGRTVARHPTTTVVQPGVEVMDGAGEPVRPLTDRVKSITRPRTREAAVLSGENLAVSLLRGNWTYFPSLCWRREVIQRIGFRLGLDVVQDLALLMDVVLDGGALVVDPEPTFRYRRHASSDSAVRAMTGARFQEEKAYFHSVARTCADRGWARAARAARGHLTSRLHAAFLASRAVRGRDLRTGVALLGHAVGR